MNRMLDVMKLGLTMLIEFSLDKKVLVITLAAIVIVPWLIGLMGGLDDLGDAFGWALLIGIASGVGAFFIAPSFFSSSFKEINYAMDWAFHVASCLGVMIYATIVVWPLLALVL